MNWFNLLALALIVVGHTELIVTLINRLESLPIPRPRLRVFRMLQDLVILVFPVLLLFAVGLGRHGLLINGSWSNLSTGWIIYFSLCAAGCAGLLISTVRWLLRQPPAIQLSNHSRTVDVAQTLGAAPISRYPLSFLARLPGNEVFRVQVSDKRYSLPRLPAAWGSLSILHLTDTHFTGKVERAYFDEITRLCEETKPDLIVFTGDLIDNMSLLPWLGATFGRLKAPLGCYYVLGNHDWFDDPDSVRAAFDRCGWQNVAGRTLAIEHLGHTLEIAGTERPWMGQHPQFDGKRDAFRVLLSHTPDHFGWARGQGVDLMLAGHNHGGQIVFPVIGPIFGPSRHGVRYASGAFWAEPTLLYVSRGLSGRRPIRFNCPPELTTLVLESSNRSTPDEARPWAGA